MMVEAGGTERTWELYEEGAPKMTEELIAEGLEESKQWIGASIDLQNRAASPSTSSRPTARSRRSRTRPNIDYTPEVFAAVSEHAEAEHRRGDGDRRQDRPQQPLDEILVGSSIASRRHRRARASSPAAPGEVKKAFRSCRRKSCA
jgi:polyribonucleotide nucleotidyltransferase